MKTWTAEELRRFLDHVRGDRMHAAWLLAAQTGLRRGELLGLRWDDIDLDAGRLQVRRSRVAVGCAVEVSEPRTRKGRRQIALDDVTVTGLKEFRRLQTEERLRWGPAWQQSGWIFTREDGAPIHPDRLTKQFDRGPVGRCASWLCRHRHNHDLRHTHATLALEAGIHPKVVSERLGHATVSITLDTYSHATLARQEDAAQR